MIAWSEKLCCFSFQSISQFIYLITKIITTKINNICKALSIFFIIIAMWKDMSETWIFILKKWFFIHRSFPSVLPSKRQNITRKSYAFNHILEVGLLFSPKLFSVTIAFDFQIQIVIRFLNRTASLHHLFLLLVFGGFFKIANYSISSLEKF